jgi:transcriptional regulator with XRE-family HTH domain
MAAGKTQLVRTASRRSEAVHADGVAAGQVNGVVGARVRSIREAAGMTLTDLAGEMGMSKAHVSRLESGDRSFSLATLLTIASGLGVPVTALLPNENSTSDVVRVTGPVVRASELQIRPLTRREDSALQPFHVIVPTDRSWAPAVTHPGEEWIYVVRGMLIVEHGGQTHVLDQGDSIHLDGAEAHRLVAAVEAELILVSSNTTE